MKAIGHRQKWPIETVNPTRSTDNSFIPYSIGQGSNSALVLAGLVDDDCFDSLHSEIVDDYNITLAARSAAACPLGSNKQWFKT